MRRLTPMRRALFAVLAVLLLAMQHEGFVHPLSHIGSLLGRAQDTGLTTPHTVDICAEDALLAAGSNVVGSENRTLACETPAASRLQPASQTRVADAPAWFHSRAPPAFL